MEFLKKKILDEVFSASFIKHPFWWNVGFIFCLYLRGFHTLDSYRMPKQILSNIVAGIYEKKNNTSERAKCYVYRFFPGNL